MAIKVRGAKELGVKLRAAGKNTPKQLSAALYQEALVLQKESMRRTPVDTGALRASHETQRPVISGRKISVTIAVGGPAAPYALWVHENLEAYHRVGQAKFLESTILEALPHFSERIARRLKVL